jgi:hypothetical protein
MTQLTEITGLVSKHENTGAAHTRRGLDSHHWEKWEVKGRFLNLMGVATCMAVLSDSSFAFLLVPLLAMTNSCRCNYIIWPSLPNFILHKTICFGIPNTQ